MNPLRTDVAVIGAGVVGTAVARDLSRFAFDTVLLEARADFGDEASKGNSAQMCSGYDVEPGTLEQRLVRRGYERYRAEAPALGLPVRQIGAMTVAFDEADLAVLRDELEAAHRAGFTDVQLVEPAVARARFEHLPAGALAVLWAPRECIVDPFSTPFAYLLDAVVNGLRYLPAAPVTGIERHQGRWRLRTPEVTVDAGAVVNCGGLGAERIEAMAGYADFTMRPRRGQYILFDKPARALLPVMLKPAPKPASRGILVTPTIFGNVLLGPTAEQVEDASDRRVTAEGLEALQAAARRLLPELLSIPAVTSFAGMRPATERSEYRLIPRLEDRWVAVAGIRSTGLSAALGIAEHVASLLVPDLVPGTRKQGLEPVRVRSLAWDDPRPWSDAAEVARDPAYGEMICHCERISLGEIRDALASPVPPRSLKALKRRTRAMFGRCQGFYCGARLQALLSAARET